MEEKGRGTPGIKGDHICASLSLMGSMQGTPKGEGREGLGGGLRGQGPGPAWSDTKSQCPRPQGSPQGQGQAPVSPPRAPHSREALGGALQGPWYLSKTPRPPLSLPAAGSGSAAASCTAQPPAGQGEEGVTPRFLASPPPTNTHHGDTQPPSPSPPQHLGAAGGLLGLLVLSHTKEPGEAQRDALLLIHLGDTHRAEMPPGLNTGPPPPPPCPPAPLTSPTAAL